MYSAGASLARIFVEDYTQVYGPAYTTDNRRAITEEES
jgi:hypothetical protein